MNRGIVLPTASPIVRVSQSRRLSMPGARRRMCPCVGCWLAHLHLDILDLVLCGFEIDDLDCDGAAVAFVEAATVSGQDGHDERLSPPLIAGRMSPSKRVQKESTALRDVPCRLVRNCPFRSSPAAHSIPPGRRCHTSELQGRGQQRTSRCLVHVACLSRLWRSPSEGQRDTCAASEDDDSTGWEGRGRRRGRGNSRVGPRTRRGRCRRSCRRLPRTHGCA
jgi:hypothetical protein